MSRMATLVGKDLTQNLFLDRFVVLCSDSSFQVRKVSIVELLKLVKLADLIDNSGPFAV